MRLSLEKRNKRQAAVLSGLLFAAVLVLCFFLTAFTIQDPPPGEQFVAGALRSRLDEEAEGHRVRLRAKWFRKLKRRKLPLRNLFPKCLKRPRKSPRKKKARSLSM